MIESALVAGLTAMGADVLLAGVLPTPGVAYLARQLGASGGIVVSASHNPFYDNGIKLFDNCGFKLSTDSEAAIENLVLKDHEPALGEGIPDVGQVDTIEKAGERYAAFIKSTIADDFSLATMKIAIDCSNGATSCVAPQLFRDLGADVIVLSAEPDGRNINADCGSQYPSHLAGVVKKEGVDVGLAFDGDGDRLVAVDEFGRVSTGDQLMAVFATHMKKTGKLKSNALVTTVMSNMGLSAALDRLGVQHHKAGVGDRLVMEKMKAEGAVLGGEDSGHIIFLDRHTTGDGMLAGLNLLAIVKSENRPLSELLNTMTVFPQAMINVDVATKPPLETVSEINEAIAAVEQKLGSEGRVLVRYSGTQPMCRVMVEGPTPERTEHCCQQIARIVAKVLG